MGEFIVNNISLLKDLSTILFALFALIISILTYFKTRRSLLQPLRTEVIKNQTLILSKLLEEIFNEELSLLENIDYYNIVQLNIFKHLDELGFKLSEHDNVKRKMIEIEAGLILVGDNKEIAWGFLPIGLENIEDKKEFFETDLSKENYTLAKEGKYKLDKLFITKKHKEFTILLDKYVKSPFMPKKMQDILIRLRTDIHKNLTLIMKSALEELINEFCVEFNKEGNTKNLSPIGAYNQFNHDAISHSSYIGDLILEIREHLRIDENW